MGEGWLGFFPRSLMEVKGCWRRGSFCLSDAASGELLMLQRIISHSRPCKQPWLSPMGQNANNNNNNKKLVYSSQTTLWILRSYYLLAFCHQYQDKLYVRSPQRKGFHKLAFHNFMNLQDKSAPPILIGSSIPP